MSAVQSKFMNLEEVSLVNSIFVFVKKSLIIRSPQN